MKKSLSNVLCLSVLLTTSFSLSAFSNFTKIASGILVLGGATFVAQLSPFDVECYKLKLESLFQLPVLYANEPKDLQQFLDENLTDDDVVAVPKDNVGNGWNGSVGFDALYQEMVRIKNAKIPLYKRFKNFMGNQSHDVPNVMPEFPVITKKKDEFKRHFLVDNEELQYVVVPRKLLIKIYYNITMSSFIAMPRIPLFTPFINSKPVGYGVDHEISLVWYEVDNAYRGWKKQKTLVD